MNSRLQLPKTWLLLVPALTAILGFALGGVAPAVYLPCWIINAALMVIAIRLLRRATRKPLPGVILLIIPWIFLAVFAGMGPPPENFGDWARSLLTQQIRYSILFASGLVFAFGLFRLLNAAKLRNSQTTGLRTMIIMSLSVSIPLFLANMIYWGFFVLRQDADIRQLFDVISRVEVALTYLATALLALLLRRISLLSGAGSMAYVSFSVLGLSLMLLGLADQGIAEVPVFLASVPAIPWIMPYLLGVNLLARRDLRRVT